MTSLFLKFETLETSVVKLTKDEQVVDLKVEIKRIKCLDLWLRNDLTSLFLTFETLETMVVELIKVELSVSKSKESWVMKSAMMFWRVYFWYFWNFGNKRCKRFTLEKHESKDVSNVRLLDYSIHFWFCDNFKD